MDVVGELWSKREEEGVNDEEEDDGNDDSVLLRGFKLSLRFSDTKSSSSSEVSKSLSLS